MQHARMIAPLALAVALVASSGAAPRAEAAAKRTPHATTATSTTGSANAAGSKAAGYRQFSGTVIALDASSITVEKGGKAPKQMVFARNANMRSTGDVEKDARVTVYWRDEAGKSVAHRVVVKSGTGGGSR